MTPTYKEQHARGHELAKALAACITAMNPPDSDGISMHEWNQRLKAATKQAAAVFDGSAEARAVLAATSAEALERARAVKNLIVKARLVDKAPSSGPFRGDAGQRRGLRDALARLDAPE